MGAEFQSTVLEGGLSKKQVESSFQEIVAQALYDYGHAGYTGTFAEADGIKFPTEKVFDSNDEARRYVDDNADKWGPALAVKCKDTDGSIEWFLGGWFSS